MADLIDRQAAIDGLDGHYIERINLNDWQAGWNTALDWLESAYLDGLPSAQPEPCEDAVSRKLMYELGATCIARRDENGKLVALGRLDMLPSVQPDIIRCKDCKYSHDEYGDGDCYCKIPGKELYWLGQRWDFYCADAKPKEET